MTDWRELEHRAELGQREAERERGPGRGVARGREAEERQREAGEHPRGRDLRQRGAEQARELAGVAGLGAWATPAHAPATSISAAVPASATAAWLSAQRVRETAVASSGSARPLVSSPRSRSTAGRRNRRRSARGSASVAAR